MVGSVHCFQALTGNFYRNFELRAAINQAAPSEQWVLLMRTRVLYITSACVICSAVIIWLNKSFFLGLPNFFAWFVGGITMVFLFVSIIIKNVPDVTESADDKTPEEPYAERREFPRIRHRLSRRPRFIFDREELEVLDISERGLRFENKGNIKLQDWVRGVLVFSDEGTLDINGLVIRKQTDTVSLQLITTIPADMLARERQYHLGQPDEPSDP